MANIVIRPYQLNVAPGGVETVVNLSQYENGRELVFHLVGEGQIVIPAGSTAIIAGTKPDDTIYSAVGYVDADENTVTFQENVQMSAAAGKWYAKVKVTASGQTVASGMVKFVVEKDVIPPDAEQSSSDIQGLIAEAAQYAEDARNSFANDARTMEFHELTTTDQTIIDALNELDGDTNALDSSVNALEALTFPNLPSLTSTADTDLIHVNSSGTDYKETKRNFLSGDFNHAFSNTSLITTQVEALSPAGMYFGLCNAYGHQTETGAPTNSNFYVEAHVYTTAYRIVYVTRRDTGERYMNVDDGGTWSGWVKDPTRSEITSLNSSLANTSLKYSDHTYTGTFTPNSSGYVKLGSIPTDFGVSINNYFVGFLIRGWSGGQGALTLAIGSNGTDLYLLSSSTTSVTSINIRMWYVPTASS